MQFAAFSPDGKRVVTASDDDTARIWDAETGKELQKLGHTGSVGSASFSPDGKQVVTASGDDTARIWDAETGRELLKFEGSRNAVFSPDGKRVVTVGGYDHNAARIWNNHLARIERAEKERQAAEKAKKEQQAKAEQDEKERQERTVDMDVYLKEVAGFTGDSISDNFSMLVNYGTEELRKKMQEADEFDTAVLKKEIQAKQTAIWGKEFIVLFPYATENLKVDESISSVDLRVPMHLRLDTSLNVKPERISTQLPDLRILQAVHSTEVGAYVENSQYFADTQPGFYTKDDKIRNCRWDEVREVLQANGIPYWKENLNSYLIIRVSGSTEAIKKLVRQKENYAVRLVLFGLRWDHPPSSGWFKHQALRELAKQDGLLGTTEVVRNRFAMQLAVAGIRDKDDKAKAINKQPDYFVTHTGDEVPLRVMAGVAEVQIVEKKIVEKK
ncbi:MAG: hypothetical protein LBT46_02040 [Planctomycetaceae bacterium]|nr:hypothetical protein [Planctomycetaceae bacterium]